MRKSALQCIGFLALIVLGGGVGFLSSRSGWEWASTRVLEARPAAPDRPVVSEAWAATEGQAAVRQDFLNGLPADVRDSARWSQGRPTWFQIFKYQGESFLQLELHWQGQGLQASSGGSESRWMSSMHVFKRNAGTWQPVQGLSAVVLDRTPSGLKLGPMDVLQLQPQLFAIWSAYESAQKREEHVVVLHPRLGALRFEVPSIADPGCVPAADDDLEAAAELRELLKNRSTNGGGPRCSYETELNLLLIDQQPEQFGVRVIERRIELTNEGDLITKRVSTDYWVEGNHFVRLHGAVPKAAVPFSAGDLSIEYGRQWSWPEPARQ